ncbi:Ribosomal RNA large subunit methyltransferase J [Alphaproteobacteria bacterium SO-S41]|nr:Ribosomal RNA large subunit methyltransferase J [Alphaproteobacteria bacterium SO-S41]
MNYRHAFHAGNHADVLKHAALMVLLGYLKAKPKPFFVLDTHGGRGLYDLTGSEALRSGEFRHGIARLLAAPDLPAELAPYLAAIRAANPPGALDVYPGSPALIAGALRRGDRLIACDLHPAEAEALGAVLKPYRGARAEARDGYAALKALLPPPERRGLVLIDPPFEKTDEFQVLAAALTLAWKRWSGGVYLIWYPLKDRAAADGFRAAVADAGIKDAACYEFFVRAPAGATGMAGSGLLAVNASFALDRPMRAILPVLTDRLAQGAGASWRAERLTPE